MIQPIEDILKIRGNISNVDKTNSNKHCIVFNEDNGSKTAYCFSMPIYDEKTKKIINCEFSIQNEIAMFNGANCNVYIDKKIVFNNAEGSCEIELVKNGDNILNPQQIISGGCTIKPTLNGIVCMVPCNKNMPYTFIVRSDEPCREIKANNKSFSFMVSPFVPLITVSCIGSYNSAKLLGPAQITYHQKDEKSFEISLMTDEPDTEYIMMEINMHSEKALQDTTVESANPYMNNAFGGTAFLGTTSVFGEQWLYTRPELNRVLEPFNHRINKIILHIPKLNESTTEIAAFRAAMRFCSFGSTWNNKISSSSAMGAVDINNEYISLDLTEALVEGQFSNYIRNDGFILKPKNKNSDFIALSTGDSYYKPQIVEINYK